MPACITHHLFAQDLLARLSEAVDQSAFFWGAQGPDFLFCHRYIQAAAKKDVKSLKEYGSALHRTSPTATLRAMREFLARRPDRAYRSYVLGFLCHYALDSTAHPYVNARAQALLEAQPWENASTLHGEIEASLDAVILRWKTGQLPSEVHTKNMFPKNEGVQRKIAVLYREVLFTVYGNHVPEEELYRATRDAHFIFACCNDPSGLKRRIFSALEKGRPHYVTSHLIPLTEDPEPDYANTQHSQWSWQDQTSRQDFFQLYEEVLDRAEKLAAHFETGDLKELTGERPFG